MGLVTVAAVLGKRAVSLQLSVLCFQFPVFRPGVEAQVDGTRGGFDQWMFDGVQMPYHQVAGDGSMSTL